MISVDLVDSCFKQDQKRSRQLLTMELDRWSKMTNLQLAVISNHKILLGHPCCQILLADLWMGALNIKTHQTLKVLGGIFFPFIVCCLEYKSTEELKLLPHQEKQVHSTHSHGRLEEYGDDVSHTSEGGQSLRTYDSKSKSTFAGNIFHRHQHKGEQQSHPQPHNPLDVAESVHVIKHIQEGHHPDYMGVGHDATNSVDKPTSETGPHVTVVQTDPTPSLGEDTTPLFSKPQHRQRSSFVTTRYVI